MNSLQLKKSSVYGFVLPDNYIYYRVFEQIPIGTKGKCLWIASSWYWDREFTTPVFYISASSFPRSAALLEQTLSIDVPYPCQCYVIFSWLTLLATSFRVISEEEPACSSFLLFETKRTKLFFSDILVLYRCPTVHVPDFGLPDRMARVTFCLVFPFQNPLERECIY